jgi:hypothetical protein
LVFLVAVLDARASLLLLPPLLLASLAPAPFIGLLMPPKLILPAPLDFGFRDSVGSSLSRPLSCNIGDASKAFASSDSGEDMAGCRVACDRDK